MSWLPPPPKALAFWSADRGVIAYEGQVIEAAERLIGHDESNRAGYKRSGEVAGTVIVLTPMNAQSGEPEIERKE